MRRKKRINKDIKKGEREREITNGKWEARKKKINKRK